MAANTNLHKAKNAKNDEFYTQLTDVSKELMHYKHHFKDKVVFCNCDDPTWSAFWKYFHLNFSALGLKKLISTHYDKTEPTYKMEYTGGDDNDIEVGVKTPLEGNGDFRNQECLDLLDEADIVVTNPPFSLFREYVACLMEHKKKFVIIGNPNAVTYKEFFPLLKTNQIWVGAKPWSAEMYFGVPKEQEEYLVTHKKEGSAYVIKDGQILGRVATIWFTNLDIAKRHEKLIFWKNYSPEEYPTYDNYDAINVDKVDQIPCDYDGVMGVPITYLDKYNPEQFEILGITLGNTVDYPMSILYENAMQHNKDGTTKGGSKVNTRATLKQTNIPVDTVYYTADNADGYLIAIYPRILIRKKVGG